VFTECHKSGHEPCCHENMVKSSPCAHHEGMMEWRYSSTHSYPRRQMGMSVQHHVLAALTQGKRSEYPLTRKLVSLRAS
jgi:hypothetical protein